MSEVGGAAARGRAGERPWHRSYDAHVPRELAYEELAIPALLARTVERHGDRPALFFRGASLSYRELGAEVDRLAAALAGLGVTPGTRVAVQLPNLPQTVVAYYAALAAGATVVMTNPLYTPREIGHQWRDAGVEVAVVADYLWERTLRPMRDELPVRAWVVAAIAEYLPLPTRWIAPLLLRRRGLAARVRAEEGVHRFRPLVREADGPPPRPPVDLDEVAVLQYTGGTTGVAKGAMLTHRNLSSNVQQLRAWFPALEPGREVMLTALPLFHVFGMTVAMNLAVLEGALQVLVPDPRDVRGVVDAIERHRVTLFPAVPAMFNAVTHVPGVRGRDLSTVKSCFSGSAPLPLEVQRRFESLTGARIVEGYGLSETSPVTHANPLEGTRKLGTIGLPVPDTDAKVVAVDDPEAELPAGAEGELLVRGPQVMRGYWNLPEATEAAFADGWLRTGDLAAVDEDGYFRIVGRKKDLILAGGYNVYPDEVDDVLAAHPAVLEAATIGVPHERRGETVKSFVVLRPGAAATAEELDRHCREGLAAYKVPREYEFLDELPKSSVLKVLRRELREREIRRRGG